MPTPCCNLCMLLGGLVSGSSSVLWAFQGKLRDSMARVPVPSKHWSCGTLDEGIKHVLRDSGCPMDEEEAALMREVEASCFSFRCSES